MSLLKEISKLAIEPAMLLLPEQMAEAPAEQMLLTIGLQESGLKYRAQHGGGPARGLCQFERGGGVKGVLYHRSTSRIAESVCMARQVGSTMQVVWEALEHDDVLAMALARLLLFTDPSRIPAEPEAAWQMYLRCWRPGKPKPDTWGGHWRRVEDFIIKGIDS